MGRSRGWARLAWMRLGFGHLFLCPRGFPSSQRPTGAVSTNGRGLAYLVFRSAAHRGSVSRLRYDRPPEFPRPVRNGCSRTYRYARHVVPSPSACRPLHVSCVRRLPQLIDWPAHRVVYVTSGDKCACETCRVRHVCMSQRCLKRHEPHRLGGVILSSALGQSRTPSFVIGSYLGRGFVQSRDVGANMVAKATAQRKKKAQLASRKSEAIKKQEAANTAQAKTTLEKAELQNKAAATVSPRTAEALERADCRNNLEGQLPERHQRADRRQAQPPGQHLAHAVAG